MNIFSIPANVAVSDTGFVFLPTTGETFTLNEIGKEILRMLQQNKNLDEITEIILENYDIDRMSLEKDINDFLAQLKNYSLLVEV
ncbi:MAG: PqqD family protein [Ignavibacteriaceae bacterium]|nr:PqqD family protein [Ignavibacteriaceae bacterium]HRI47884.1 PqqD family protein [Ignavibacteriaceae bacterium]